jgi:hypothetical protein
MKLSLYGALLKCSPLEAGLRHQLELRQSRTNYLLAQPLSGDNSAQPVLQVVECLLSTFLSSRKSLDSM